MFDDTCILYECFFYLRALPSLVEFQSFQTEKVL